MRKLPLLLLAAVLQFVPASAVAQEYEQPPMYWVYQDYVQPSQVQDFEAASKKMIGMFESASVTGVEWVTISGPEIGYIYAIPIEGFAGIGEAWKNWEAAVEAVGRDQFMEIQAEFGAMLDHSASSVLMLRPDLSYRLDDTALTAERPFRMYHWYYALPGKEQDLEKVAREFVQLYESKGVEMGWRVYQVVIGPELPAYVVVETAADEAEYYAQQKKASEMVGEEGARLDAKAMQATRRMDVNGGWIRPDLSYPQTAATASNN